MSYLCIYNTKPLIAKGLKKNIFNVTVCFSSLFSSIHEGNFFDIKIIIPFNINNNSDFNSTYFTYKEIQTYISNLRKIFGNGIYVTKVKLNSIDELPHRSGYYNLDFLKKQKDLEIIIINIKLDKLSFDYKSSKGKLFLKLLVTSIRYLYELPYLNLLRRAFLIYNMFNKEFNLFNILLLQHYKINECIGEGHSISCAIFKNVTVNPNILHLNYKDIFFSDISFRYSTSITYSNKDIITNLKQITQ